MGEQAYQLAKNGEEGAGWPTAIVAAITIVAAAAQRSTLAAPRRGSWGGRRREALTAPRPAAPRWRSSRQLGSVAALAAAWCSAAALPRRQLALSVRCVALNGSRSACGC